MPNYLVATIKSWNIDNFHKYQDKLPGNWHLITKKEDLNEAFLSKFNPKYIFFPHWSWLVPETIFSRYCCICFHMTDLPFGRGGSPLQNLISRGYEITKLSVLKMTAELDAGPIYFKYPLTLEGNAEDILKRASLLSYEAIKEFIQKPVEPKEQIGETTIFSRRSPDESLLPNSSDLKATYDHIRMLDAEGYPKAYINHAGLKIEFYNAQISNDTVTATVDIKRAEYEK